MSNSNTGKNNKQMKRLLNTIIKGDFNMIFSKLLYKILGSFSKKEETTKHPLEFTETTAKVEDKTPAKPKKPRKPRVVK